jgi:hypothetical protein
MRKREREWWKIFWEKCQTVLGMVSAVKEKTTFGEKQKRKDGKQ